MPDWLSAILFGIVEGVTEFLPISSTGHLIIAERWLKPESDLFLTVIQSGAVLAVITVFFGRLKDLVLRWREPQNMDYATKLIVAFFITGVGGLLMKKFDFELPETPTPVAWVTLIGGVAILIIEYLLKNKETKDQIPWGVAIAIAIAQLMAAMLPGLSRSGSTILMAMAFGVNRKAATEFSFLLGVPTLLAAGGLQIISGWKDGSLAQEDIGNLVLATIVSAITAFLVVKWLLKFVQSHTFVGFGYYRIVLGIVILLIA